jgi:hypothetical protein
MKIDEKRILRMEDLILRVLRRRLIFVYLPYQDLGRKNCYELLKKSGGVPDLQERVFVAEA